jgi:hypothetical protein
MAAGVRVNAHGVPGMGLCVGVAVLLLFAAFPGMIPDTIALAEGRGGIWRIPGGIYAWHLPAG